MHITTVKDALCLRVNGSTHHRECPSREQKVLKDRDDFSWLTVPCIAGYLASLWRPLPTPSIVTTRKHPTNFQSTPWRGRKLPYSRATTLETQQKWLDPKRLTCWDVHVIVSSLHPVNIRVCACMDWVLRAQGRAKPDPVPAFVGHPCQGDNSGNREDLGYLQG